MRERAGLRRVEAGHEVRATTECAEGESPTQVLAEGQQIGREVKEGRGTTR